MEPDTVLPSTGQRRTGGSEPGGDARARDRRIQLADLFLRRLKDAEADDVLFDWSAMRSEANAADLP